MCKVVRRGSAPKDDKEFNREARQTLYQAGADLSYLLDHGYQIKGASTFVGNHYLLSERQRMAFVRGISSRKRVKSRREKEIVGNLAGTELHIDGFNTIITLEVALSDSLLIKCMDGTIRDLAGLRGTYRIIDKTKIAIENIGERLMEHKIRKAVFFLDAPVSNSGKLKQLIYEVLNSYPFEVEVLCINNVDTMLEKLDYVVTSDAIILDKCQSWVNLNRELIEEQMQKDSFLDFSCLYKR